MTQTSRNVGFVCLHVVLHVEFLVAALIFDVCFSLPFLACSDEDP